MFRSISSYLIKQYFLDRKQQCVEFDLHGLDKIYKNIQIVNSSMAKRLRAAQIKDTAVNSIIILDLFAKAIPYSIDDALEELSYLYKDIL